MRWVATCTRGAETVLAAELEDLGAARTEVRRGAVAFEGALETAYRACLWSRVASRILRPLATFPTPDAESLYAAVSAVAWEEHLDPDRTFAVSSAGRSPVLRHSGYASLKTKDAVADRLRQRRGRRPDVNPVDPDVRLHLHLDRTEATISVDLAGEPLHRRGYRPRDAAAPLKENLAAALLLIARWPSRAAEGAPLVDPLCGSGTLLVEAAWMAGDVAPGLGRRSFGFESWLGHDAALWKRLRGEARARAAEGRHRVPPILGFDADAGSLEAAERSVQLARLEGVVRLERRRLADCTAPPGAPAGLVVTNPPYGVRLQGRGEANEAGELLPLYQTLGDVLRRQFAGWDGWVLTANRSLAKRIGLRAAERHVLFNGALECRLLHYPISPEQVRSDAGPGWRRRGPDAAMLDNRLRKNVRRLGRWARRHGIQCYRLYDADVPEYNLAVDLYGDAAVVQEYERPPHVDARRAEQHLQDALLVIPETLSIEPDAVFLKVRRRQRRGAQYGRRTALEATQVVHEGGHRFEVNLSDYIDTGLFLDQRWVRREIGELVGGRTFLNLFCYTGSATVYAAAGGARATTSIDLSNTYLEWARRNLTLNGIDPAGHEMVRSDCLAWMARERRRFGVILLAPPTFSRSKGMRSAFDLRKDWPGLISSAASRLEPNGVLLFVTHALDLDPGLEPPGGLRVEEISHRTVPADFARSPHRCFRVTLRPGG